MAGYPKASQGAGLELAVGLGLGDGVVDADGTVADGVGLLVGVTVALEGLGLGACRWRAGAVDGACPGVVSCGA